MPNRSPRFALSRSHRVAGFFAALAWAQLDPLGTAVRSCSAQMDALVPEQKSIAIEAFFEVLRDYGTWVDTERYGHVFCPHPDVLGADFQPYRRGHWTMSELGWTFVSSSKISWVTDHYGRWVELGVRNCGWGWVPGRDWSPAWVEFRVSDRVIAWRPTPHDGQPVRMNLPQTIALPRLALPGAVDFSRDTSDGGFVVVNDNDFTARRIESVALTGSQQLLALRDTEPLLNPHLGLHATERRQIVARILAKREAAEAQAASAVAGAGPGRGKAPVGEAGSPAGAALGPSGALAEPARRKKAPAGAAGVSGLDPAATVRTTGATFDPGKEGAGKRSLSGPKPGESPPGRSTLPAGFTPGTPGELNGPRIFEWGGPDKKKPPKPATPTPTPTKKPEGALP